MIYIYRYKDEAVKSLEKAFKKNGLFYDSIPDDIISLAVPNAVFVFDDCEQLLMSKKYAPLIIHFSSILIHHLKVTCLIVLQSFELFYARCRIHSILPQCSVLILFRNMTIPHVVRRVLNDLNVELSKEGEKGYENLFDLFKSEVNERFKYIIINMSQNLPKSMVYKGVIYQDDDMFVLFT